MQNDLIGEFEHHEMTKDMWRALMENFELTSVRRLHALIIKFDNYKWNPQHSMKKHLCVMAIMIKDKRAVSHTISGEHKIQTVLASMLDSFGWNRFKQNMAHKENMKKFAQFRHRKQA